MKVSLELEFENDKLGPLIVLHAGEMYSCLSQVEMYIRNHLKHGDPTDAQEVFERIKLQIREVLERMEP